MVYDAVKKRADEKGVSIYELEKRVGLTNGSIIKWNDSIPRSDRLYSVATILGCTVEELLCEAGIEAHREARATNDRKEDDAHGGSDA